MSTSERDLIGIANRFFWIDPLRDSIGLPMTVRESVEGNLLTIVAKTEPAGLKRVKFR